MNTVKYKSFLLADGVTVTLTMPLSIDWITDEDVEKVEFTKEGLDKINKALEQIEAKYKTIESYIKKQDAKIQQLNEAMSYVAKIMDDQDKNKIILPENNNFVGSIKL